MTDAAHLRPRPGESAAALAARLPAEVVLCDAAGRPLDGEAEHSLLTLGDELRRQLAERMLGEACSLQSALNLLIASALEAEAPAPEPPAPR